MKMNANFFEILLFQGEKVFVFSCKYYSTDKTLAKDRQSN